MNAWMRHNMFNFARLMKNDRVYLDHAAATPLRASVQASMAAVETHFANPSAIHQEGVAAREVIETARTALARCIKVRPEGVTFTGSGTESNNLAIVGTVYELYRTGRAYHDMEIVTTKLEHPSVSGAVTFVASLGVTVKYVAVNDQGMIEIASLRDALSEKTVLLTTSYINSEIGVIQPLGKIVRVVRKAEQQHSTRIVVHADAAQAPYWVPCQFDTLSVDMLSLDAAKAGGPKGVGVLARRHGVSVSPVLFGGPQEGGLRPSTEQLVGIVGGVEAIVSAQAVCNETSERVAILRDRLLQALLSLPNVALNGDVTHRVANNINVSVLGLDSEFLTINLDAAGIAASTKSACSGASGGGSQVVREISHDDARATSTLRLTLGPATSEQDIEVATAKIVDTITRLQAQQQRLTHG